MQISRPKVIKFESHRPERHAQSMSTARLGRVEWSWCIAVTAAADVNTSWEEEVVRQLRSSRSLWRCVGHWHPSSARAATMFY